MIEKRDIRLYVYNYASMKKVNERIPGLKRNIHKSNSIIEAMQYIDIIRKRNPKNIKKQYLITDFTTKLGGEIVKLY